MAAVSEFHGPTWEVPRNDLADYTKRFVSGVSDLVQARFDGAALDLVCPAGVVANGADSHGQIRVLGPAEGLAVVQSLESGELILMLFHQVRETREEFTTLVARRVVAPDSVEGLLGGSDGSIDILGRTLRDTGDDFAIRRVNDTEKQARRSANGFIPGICAVRKTVR